MQRGVLTLTKEELKSLLEVFDLAMYSKIHLSNKLKAGMDAQLDPVPLELSEDELEIMSDEFSVPTPNESEAMKQVRIKIMELMMKFRNPISEV
ncbi:hypothetical protein HYV12_02775 [Candidatus Dojkabacteria bacterium]|nr:hypothetical protein [Candidatus Dojkabacteria bacterium]